MGNKEEYRTFGKKLCVLGRLMTSYHYAWLRDNHEYVYIRKEIIEEMKNITKEKK